ncbi:MAG: hypothetical protein L3J20_05145 [Flavobacteriaceae bacterium]|nr:hypothetical protein [Flavobacteriaceae bacterium]
MNNKILFLIAGIITSLVFIGYLAESEPHKMFGYSINIWIVRLAWLIIAISNFANYFKLKKTEKK